MSAEPINAVELFAGIGGLSLGLERAGITVVGQVEIDPFCRKVLTKHWPEVPKHDDVRTAVDWWRSQQRPRVDLVAGGFPCQDLSVAGLRVGIEGERSGLWAHFAAVVRALRPRYVLVENTTGLLARGMGRVVGDLAASGYDVEWDCVPAAAVGAPHLRAREFLLAHPGGPGLAAPEPARAFRRPAAQRGGWPAEPRVGRVAHGLPARVDRLHALGNAVVPQVAEHLGRLIVDRIAADAAA